MFCECQDGWLQYGSRCFRVFTTAATWNDSEQNCVNMGGHLASVHSSEEYTFIQDLMLNATNSNSTWLGGTDAAQEGVWVWTDGSAFDYINWSPGRPDYLGFENCIEMNVPVYWNNVDCTALLPSVCAKCQNGWYQFGSRCFRIYTAAVTWSYAEQNCVNMGGHLASVHSSEEYTFIQELVLNATNSNSQTWLGGTDAAQEGVWAWTDGSAFNYNNWSYGQPDNGYWYSENCLMMNFPVSWNDAYCDNVLPSVCAKTITTTTVPSTTVPSTMTVTTSGPPTPENVMVMRLKVNSSKDLMTSDSSQLFLQQLKGKLIDGGLPSNFTLRFRSINKKSP
ncbi:macrophage mannose receptor 1-like [Colossoma macropomum]|uniref:macrophage mannose receptor 1-like n=1 Tax=Colossoma macropomum TaxID=42526 RepID=UPI001865117B|nr:macrophage mannose receptor 1-like [Colossoma macropomum]